MSHRYTQIHTDKNDQRNLSVCICVYLWFFLWFSFCSAAEWKITPVSSLQKLTATAPGVLEKFTATPATLQAARGEWENFQIVVQAGDKPLENVEPILADLKSGNSNIPYENIHLFWENYVYVPRPSGNRHIEKLWWPDALIPAEDQDDTSIAPYRARVLWVNVRVPAKATPGDYKSVIQIKANEETRSLPFSLRIEDVDLPAPTCRANVAVYYDVLREWYKKNVRDLNDTEFAQLKKIYYDFLLDYRLNAYDLPVPWESDEAQKYLRDPRVLSVRTPPLDRADFTAALAAFKKAGAQKKAYYYWIDEPAPERYAEIKTTTRKLRKLGIRHCVTVHPNNALNGAVDIWCPNIGDFFGLGHLDFVALDLQRYKGAETWWYTMVEPRFPYPTWLLDDDAAAIRLYGWLMARHEINGFVYSMAHGWGPKPLENLESFANTNGDGTLLYPAAALNPEDLSPLPSIRLMLLRDAIEDYELARRINPFTLENLERDTGLASWGDTWLEAQQNMRRWQNWPKLRQGLFKLLKQQDTMADALNRLSARGLLYPPLLPVSRLPVIDGQLMDVAWNAKTKFSDELRRLPNELAPVPTNLWMAYSGQNLLIAARCSLIPRPYGSELKGEWFAVDLASLDTEVRWRFVVTPSGKGVVEKHTREGHFRIEGVKWKFAARATRDFYNVEMQIPLNEIGLKDTFQCNARRRLDDTARGLKYLLNATPDAGNVTLMPIFKLQKASRAAKP